MWKLRGHVVVFLSLFTLTWWDACISAELPVSIFNVSFFLETFDPENGLTVGATVATNGYQALLDNTTFALNYTLDCYRKTTGLQRCSVRIGSQLQEAGLAFLKCSIKGVQVCQEADKDNCLFSAYIMGRNKDGATIKSDVMQRLLVNAVPLLPVRGLKAKTITSSTVKLMWYKPDCPKMSYVYIIEVSKHTSMQKKYDDKKQFSYETTYEISGLKPYTKYKFCVSAQPYLRREAKSSGECISTKTAEGVPQAVPIIEHVKSIPTGRDIGKAVVYWKVNSFEKLNGKLNKFVISYATKMDLNDWKNKSVPSTAGKDRMNCTLTDLFIDQEYALKIWLVTGGGAKLSQVKSFGFTTRTELARQSNIMKHPLVVGVPIIVIILLVVIGVIGVIGVSVVAWCRRLRRTTESQKSLDEEQLGSIYPRSSEYQQPQDPDDANGVYHTIDKSICCQVGGCPDEETLESTSAGAHRTPFDPLPEEPSEGC